ncbi:MAG: gamma-butyrobetaine dioxygenase [Ilumatobacteraceae bacterium]|nr:gamma-butyrobetaine dioxygenase [Ilumatobacteraceae bacterium]
MNATVHGPSFHEVEVGPKGRHLPAGTPVSASATPDTVEVTFADEHGATSAVVLDASWLRDNCPCVDCRIIQTDERRWQPWRDVDAPTATSVSVADGALTVEWASGHRSAFTADAFAAIDRAMHRGSWTGRAWTAGYEVERFDHDAAVADPVTKRHLYEAFRRDGAIVVSGCPVVPGTVMDLTRSLGLTIRDSSLGLIFDVKLDPAGYNIAYTAEEVPPHNDNAQYTNPPSGQVLAMLVNDATGGESVVVDSWSVVEQLIAADPTAADVLARVPVGHRQYSTDAEGFSRNPLLVRDRRGHVLHLRFSNQLMQPLEYDDPDLAAWYRAYRLLGSIISDPANHVTFRLNAGDTLYVNNHRVLHSRTAFVPDGPRHLQDIYFDVDDVFGNLARMTGEATDAMVAS